MARPFVERGDGVAESGAASVADVKGTGRVGGDELDVDLERRLADGAPVVGPLVHDAAVGQGELILREPEVDEARAGDLGAGHQVGRQMELLEHAFRRLPRITALLAREHHRQVGGEIAVARVARTLEDKLDPVGAEPRGHPRELGAERVAHSPAAFFFLELEEVDSVGPVLAAGSFFGLEDESAASDLPVELSAAGAAGSFRGPFPSFP